MAQPGGRPRLTPTRPRCWAASPCMRASRSPCPDLRCRATRDSARSARGVGAGGRSCSSPTTAGIVRAPVKLAVQLGGRARGDLRLRLQDHSIGLPGETTSSQLGFRSAVPITVFWLLGHAEHREPPRRRRRPRRRRGRHRRHRLLLAAGRPAAGRATFSSPPPLPGPAQASCCSTSDPARVFMGDSGAHFLGVALGVISIVGVAKVAAAFALVVPVLALGAAHHRHRLGDSPPAPARGPRSPPPTGCTCTTACSPSASTHGRPVTSSMPRAVCSGRWG